MSSALVAFYLTLQALYFVVAFGQIVLVASKFHSHVVGKLQLTRLHSDSVSSRISKVLHSIQDKFVAFSSLALLSCCILTALRALLFTLGYTRVVPCALMAHFGASMFQVFKTLMYLVFIFRAEAIYRDTLYAYSTRRMATTAAFVVFYNTVLIVLYNVFISGFEKRDVGALCVCGAKVPMTVLIPTILEDIVLSFWFLYLFTKPLQLLQRRELRRSVTPTPTQLPLECRRSNETGAKQESDNGTDVVIRESTASRSVELGRRGGDDETTDLRRVAVKCAVVTWVAVASTFINLLLIGSIGFLELIVLDWLINNTCMIFMTNWCDRYFPKVCCVPLAVARIVPSAMCCGEIPEFAAE